MRKAWFLCVLVVISGCGETGGEARDFFSRGEWDVGVATTTLTDDARDRTLPVEVWYPATESGTSSPVLEFETDFDKSETLSTLLDEAPPECVATTTGATRGADASAGQRPVVLYSHCFGCTRWSTHAVMERLASHGFVVVAPDHTGDTLFDQLADNGLPLDLELVNLRVADLRFVLDEILAGGVLPNGATANASQVGVLGHSIGSITVGATAAEDSRIAATLGMAAPMDNPLIQAVSINDVPSPVGFLLATEDNSIGEFGNGLLNDNFAAANTPAYKLDIVDAGHWSVTNISGIAGVFLAGCGDGERQTNGQAFTYLSVDVANDITATYVTAFFAAHLESDATAQSVLRSNLWPSQAPLAVRE